jgi:hypothetical protein
MPQETNLNVSPYFDDFDADKNYHRVLFKPGYPIQARELTTLQSILQNQVEQFGNHIFKEGSVVIPGLIRVDSPLYAIQIESSYNGTPVSLYFTNLLGKKLRGSVSGVSAEVVYTLNEEESERNNFTLYVKYLENGGVNFENSQFFDGETLVLQSSLTYGNLGFTVQENEGICNTISTNANSVGSSAIVNNGVYFVRGNFVSVKSQRIILDQYSSSPSYKIGFDITESIVSADEDESLYDNAKGFSNYAAPGSDRLKIELTLSKKNIEDLETNNFVEIVRVQNGSLIFKKETTQYSLIRDELAKRTYDESGDYYIKPFTVSVRESLNDRVRSDGLYYNNELTANGSTPSDDLLVYKISPGKAYVKGYDVEKISSVELVSEKPRTTKTIEDEVIRYDAGTSLILNRGFGSPTVGLGTTAFVSLMDSRIGVSSHVSVGTTIGVARVYDFIPETDYVDNTSRINLRLFDIETFTQIGLTTSISSLPTPSLITGKRSKASGYLKSSITNSRLLTLYGVSGSFLENEPITINGIDDGRLINQVNDFNISDVKSIYSTSGISTFNSDVVLSQKESIAPNGTIFTITASSSGISTISAGLDIVFTNRIKSGDIVSYASTILGGDIIYNKVESVDSNGLSFSVSGITTITSICNGKIPSTSTQVSNIVKVSGLSESSNTSLMTKLRFDNISNVSLESQEVLQRRQFSNQSFSGGFIRITITEPDLFFASFDEDRFVITYSDGSIEPMRFDKYDLDTTGKILTFYGLKYTSGTAAVVTTIKNIKPSFKQKNLNTASTLVIDKSQNVSSGIGTTTLNDGLTYSGVYGVRVQDNEICLNAPDIVRVIAVYESADTSNPQLPRIQLTGFTGPSNNNQDFVIGEQITGKSSGAVALVVGKVSTDSLEYVYLNTNQFSNEEVIVGSQSNINATITSKIISTSKDISQNFYLDDGQRSTYYDYGRLIRKEGTSSPAKKLKIVFQNYTISDGDTGEFIVANSYPSSLFKYDVPLYENRRSSDHIDIRPRVSPFVLSANSKSPFEFDSRNFSGEGQYSRYTLCPDENLILSYSYYLPRVDVIYLKQDGSFEIVKGIPNESPTTPDIPPNSFNIAKITLPPYLYNVKNVNIDNSQHKRYIMADISLLEDRIDRLEKYTKLSMLESKVENYIIKDSVTGLDRFKCGFFVDNFDSHVYHDLENPSFNACTDFSSNTLRPLHYTTTLDLELGSEGISGFTNTFSPNSDRSYPSDIGSTQVTKTGELITLAYNNAIHDSQRYASTTENVVPYLVGYWEGMIELRPSFDNWIEEKVVTKETTITNDPVVRDNLDDIAVSTLPPSPNPGIPAFDWIANARDILTDNLLTRQRRVGRRSDRSIITVRRRNPWLRIGSKYSNGTVELTSKDLVDRKVSNGIVNGTTIHLEWKGPNNIDRRKRNGISYADLVRQLLPPDIAEDYITRILNSRSGRGRNRNKGIISLDFTPPNVGGEIFPPDGDDPDFPPTFEEDSETVINVTTESIQYLRSRNIEFDIKRLKPRTKFSPFFENIDVFKYIIPKLLEIRMVSGSFQIGETVESDPHFTTASIKFRLCTPNHKTGPYNAPQETYKFIPYAQSTPESAYSGSSTVLNIDTRALQLPTEVEFFGSVGVGMKLIGKTSGAVATITDIRLVSDNNGRLIGSLFIPDSTVPGNPKWLNGQNTFSVVGNTLSIGVNNISSLASTTDSSAESEFASEGSLEISEINIITTRTPIVPTPKPPVPEPPLPPIPPEEDVEICTSVSVNKNPALTTASEALCGWFSRVNDNDNSPYEDVGDVVIKWNGSVVYDSSSGTGRYNRQDVREYSGEVDSREGNGIIENYQDFVSPINLARFNTSSISRETKHIGLWGIRVGDYVYFPVINTGKFNLNIGTWPAPEDSQRKNDTGVSSWDVARIKASLIPLTVIRNRTRRKDPLAQSFFVEDETGVFLTGVDVFFETKDDDIPVTLQLRTMIAGVPSNVIIPFSEVTLEPENINISADGSVATRFTFPSPVYLSGVQEQSVRVNESPNSEYSIVLLSDSPNYRVFISRLGELDIQTGTRISTQPTLGSLFKSQNGTTWNPSQFEDLKYTIYRASFTNEGVVRFFNPKLSTGNNKLTVTSTNSFTPLSKKIIVGLGSTGFDSTNVVPGVTLSQGSATGTLIGIAGSITESGIGVTISNVGVGYSVGAFIGISLQTETGTGTGAVATIGVTTVGIATVTITSGGFGYLVGDSLSIPRIQNLGYGGKVTVTSIGSTNTFIIDEVQGTFSSGITTLNYINSSGITTQVGSGVTINTISQDQYYDGLHMKVFHQNHGMHSTENYVKIEQFRPTSDAINSVLTEELLVSDTTISVQSDIGFTEFEGKSVSASNIGYVIIGNEVIGYAGVTGNILTSITRGVDGSQVQSYLINSPVFKYEFNGVSIRRINKVHNFAQVDDNTHPIDLNSYHIKIDMASTDFGGAGIGSNRSNDLYFKKTAQSGRAGTVLSNNIQYEILAPKINSIVPSGTDMTSRVRTFSGTSVSGNEKSFVDAGYQDLPLNGRLYFQSPRIICSDINEQNFITESPQRKSFSMDILMSTNDERVSPVIDINPPPSLILTSNLINNPIGLDTVSAYADSLDVRGVENDPHAAIYVSKPIHLTIPANSITVILSANKNETNDIRVLYQVFRPDQSFAQDSFELFPGYSNYKVDGIGRSVVNVSLSDGTPDFFVKESNDGEFKEYIYTVDNLPPFTAFAIKIVMAGTNQASPPLVSQLRAIATRLPQL